MKTRHANASGQDMQTYPHLESNRRIAGPAVVVLLLVAGCSPTPVREPVRAVFYPGLPEAPRVQFLTSISSEQDIGVERNRFREFVTGKSDSIMALGRPWDVDHVRGRLYVSDKAFRRIVVVDLENRRMDLVEDRTGGSLANPGGIFVDTAGYKFIADRERRGILVFDQADAFVRAYEAGPEFEPIDVVAFGDRIFAADVGTESIKVFDRRSGAVIETIGGQGESEGTFRFPTHLTVDDAGNVFVTDFLNFRVQEFDADGKFVRTIGEPGDFPGAMPRPKGIAVDRDGHLYVVDSAFEIVQIFNVDTGLALMPFGKFGSSHGGTWLPAGVHVDYDNLAYFSRYLDPDFRAEYLIYVTNQAGPFKINVYAFGSRVGNTGKDGQPAAQP